MYHVKCLKTFDLHCVFLAKQHLMNKRRNSIMMTCHHPDLSSASDQRKQISLSAQPTILK